MRDLVRMPTVEQADAVETPAAEPVSDAVPAPAPVSGLAHPMPGAQPMVQRSPRVGAADDPAEAEADRTAQLVVELLRTEAAPVVARSAQLSDAGSDAMPSLQPLRRAAAVVGAAGGELDAQTGQQIESLRGAGVPLPLPTRQVMESAFRADLSAVRVHTGGQAAQLTDRLAAHAFTTGNDIVFAQGMPDVQKESGQRLLAHELSHVLQQRGSRDVVGALRRQSAAVAPSPLTGTLTVGMLSATPQATTDSDDQADADGVIRRVWDIAVRLNENVMGELYIENIVISDRPKGPNTSGMTEHGGKSFHHESAWTWLEKHVTQFVNHSLSSVVDHVVKYGISGVWPAMADPGADSMKRMIALNKYFHDFLETKAAQAEGWLGPTGSHSSQGGKVSAAIKALNGNGGWTKANIFKALTVSFEPGPDVKGEALWHAAQAHGDTFYGAYQQFLEKEGPNAAIGLDAHQDILEIIKDWDTEFWDPKYDEMEINSDM